MPYYISKPWLIINSGHAWRFSLFEHEYIDKTTEGFDSKLRCNWAKCLFKLLVLKTVHEKY
ncbi:hypothetical protein GCM10007028_20910 [Algibacter mikhailovii]|uniref:Uncharacterized protein n=1 Tax=Algibacter mikhailovii TaxID=425498 RepID=A0A918VA18_9FLAO|nr:hypothetical protein GCM10007028_20910 [Algibacter mikhailovii]